MDEDTLRRILGEFASGIMERFDRVEREISGIYATLEKVEQRLDSIERQLDFVKSKIFEHEEEIFHLRRGMQG
ncbi:MAG TPA: hypothetical protein GX517_02180 [Alicyclobacillus sp.]|nr:hypothetical protein [Alicyclobacillus sp.]